MGNMFSAPRPQAASVPAKSPEVTPLPVRDDEAERREKQKTYAAASRRGGRESTNLTQSRLGDMSLADTRSGSSVLGAE